jgi:glutathione peroxidase
MQKPDIYGFRVRDAAGRERSLEEYKGNVLLIVNTASACGFTPQLDGLEKLYQKYKDRGFAVLGFPSNQFAGQEPLDDGEIGQFCQVNYGVSFPIFGKLEVKGKEADPLFRFLSERRENGTLSSRPRWNFHKYLIDRQGRVRDFYLPFTKPEAGRLHKAIEELLDEDPEAA